jgi:hypothetical protein
MEEQVSTRELIEKISQELEVTPDAVRAMMVSDLVDNTRIGNNPAATRKRRAANKNARQARRRNR